jgi:hypothetical protein
MKRALLIIAVAALSLAACNKENQENGKGGNGDSYAVDAYWADDYSGVYGIQIETPAGKTAMMTLGGQPLYVTGVNCYNLFVQCHESGTMSTANMEQTVAVMAEKGVPIVRFSCSPYYPSQMTYYVDQKAKYLGNLEKLAELCDENHILLIPSVFWNTSCLPEYFGEALKAWGSTSSKTYQFMIEYTTDIVNTLKGHKCLAAWEFGNEFNLAADISSAGYPDIPAADVGTAYKGFAETVASLDPQGRMICSGNSVMRNAQWNLANNGSWSTDSFDQYVTITGVMTPDPMNGMSEHIYEETRSFSDLGNLNRTQQVIRAKEAAASLGKGYYVGEFTGPGSASNDTVAVKKHYTTYYSQKVQISLIWNYALKGDTEYSFKAGTPGGEMVFRQMRNFNQKFKEMQSK